MKTKLTAIILAATATAALAAPANATTFTYHQSNGSVLTIDTATQTGTLIGRDINTRFTSSDFANFTGGANPRGTFNLDSLDGFRIINGRRIRDNTSHPQRLTFGNNGRTNLWSYWGRNNRYGDYITRIRRYTPPTSSSSSTGGSSSGGSTGGSSGGTNVPAPGMVLLFGAGAAALAFRRRKIKQAD